MSQPTPHHPTHPTTTHIPTATHIPDLEPRHVDVVAGDPPVPLTVWRTARTPADQGKPIGARLAARLVAAYSHPGDEVLDLTDGHALAAPCAAGGRVHLPGWFTDASSLIIGPASPPTPHPAPSAHRGRRQPAPAVDEEAEAPELSAWFGDDLTDPDLPHGRRDPSASTGTHAETMRDARTIGLVVAHWPLHETPSSNQARLGWLLTACARLLRPGGCLILVVTAADGAITGPEDFTPLVAAAVDIGMAYLQHIVAVHATLATPGDAGAGDSAGEAGGDVFVYHATDEELLALAATTAHGQPVAHLRVHADLLVFTRTGADARPRSGRAPRAGGHRD